MSNKAFSVILALLVIMAGSIGYYSYNLNLQVQRLGRHLDDVATTQTVLVDAFNSELDGLRRETAASLGGIKDSLGDTQAKIDSLSGELGTARDDITGLQEDIGDVTAQVGQVKDSVSGTLGELSLSMIDAGAVFAGASQAVVRIGNGQATAGSGTIYDTSGHVITAAHVIDGLSQIYVSLYDGRVYRATVTGESQPSDIAILKLDGNPGITPPPLADSAQIKIGEPVAAIGSPLDLRDTLTAGIISQVNRYTEIQYDTGRRSVANLLQFDAAVNPGNSGCPLFNARGEIIGVVIARVNPNEGDGIYYAVSSNKARRVAEALIGQGSFDYPWLGVGINNLTPEQVKDQNLADGNGVLVSSVFGNSPAQNAGIQVEDIIVSLDGAAIRDTADLTSYLGEFTSPGDNILVGLLRGAARLSVSLKLGSLP